ncbi:MAG: DNA replication/repair protein RecF [Acidimicrobiales bacterium]
MLVRSLWLGDFRSYTSAELQLATGLTAVVGRNGAGKTNLLEGLAWLATLSSFRGAPVEALVRQGAPYAVVRAEIERDQRELLIEAQLMPTGRNRVQVNRQPLRRARDVLGSLRVTVFTPDDLTIVKGGPGERRHFLDEALVALHPRNDALRTDVERVLRQRGALLKQTGGMLDEAAAFTLDVWDTKLVEAGEALARARVDLLDRVRPVLAKTYADLAVDPARPQQTDVEAAYESAWWARGLADALSAARRDDLRRGVSTVGPHRDDVALSVGGFPARTQCSQGEQRTLALALRLAVHRVIADELDSAPVLLLDDVFSELDPDRSQALLAHLPAGQVLLTTAGDLPPGASPDRLLRIVDGRIVGPSS